MSGYVPVPPPPNRLPPEQRRMATRSRRKREVRASTISIRNMTKTELAIGRALYPEPSVPMPVSRGDCMSGPRPCPLVRCKFHLFLDVSPATHSIKLNFPDLDPEDLVHSCALDVADAGGVSLEALGAIMNLTRERARQIEVQALRRMEQAGVSLREYSDEGPVGKRRLPVLQGGGW